MFLPLICIISFLSFFSYLSLATDTLTPSDTLSGSQTLISAGGVFELGLFNEISSGYFYLGIWFRADASKVVWVSYREIPMDSSVQLQIRSGNLILTDRRQLQMIVNTGGVASVTNTSATLLDSGNFVLKEGDTGTTIWQSFDDPTDTYLPGMKIGFFGLNTTQRSFSILTSWANPQNPARGFYSLSIDQNNFRNLSVWRADGVEMVIAFWDLDGSGFRFIFDNKSTTNNFQYQSNEYETFYTFSTRKNYDLMWFVMASTGRLDQYFMLDGKISNVSHALCADSAGGNNGMCLTSLPSKCEGGGKFSEINGSLPSSLASSEIWSSDINGSLPSLLAGSKNWSSDCETLCKSNCSCTAFTFLQNEKLGCLLYYGSKHDLLKAREKRVGVIYIRSVAPSDDKKWKIWAIMGPVASLLVLIPISLFCYQCRRKRHKGLSLAITNIKGSPIQHDELKELRRQKDQELPFFSFSTIKTATDNFAEANKLGQGGFGPVYKGQLLVGQEIAAKRLSKISRQGSEEFKNEVTVICKLQHRNLVRLLGCCIEAEESILIYEYMPNKSLDSFIFDSTKQVILDWRRRISIIEGIAQGLLYLHKYSRLRIIHRDLKTSNILLDRDLNPKISDFGMARIFGDNDTRGQTNRVVGTFGYMSPEYAMDGLFSEKSDVFSFGVILLEIISSKKNIAFFEADQSQNLLGKAWNLWKEDNSMALVDSTLRASCSSSEVVRCIQVGLLCVQERAIDRPSMSDVVAMLSNQSFALCVPKEPAFLSQVSSTGAYSATSRQGDYSKNDITISEEYGR